MISILLCDDQQQTLEYYNEVIQQIINEQSLDAVILNFISGNELLNYMNKRRSMADIIFLDIQMGGIGGMETARILREMGCYAQIIFLTSAEEYVFDAFKVEPVAYLVKSKTDQFKLREAFNEAVIRVNKMNQECFTVETASFSEKILLKDIIYFSVNGRMVTLHQASRDIEFYGRMDQIEEQLDGKGFIRTHRSYLVNGNYIRHVDHEGALIGKEMVIPISTANYSRVKKHFSRYLLKDI